MSDTSLKKNENNIVIAWWLFCIWRDCTRICGLEVYVISSDSKHFLWIIFRGWLLKVSEFRSQWPATSFLKPHDVFIVSHSVLQHYIPTWQEEKFSDINVLSLIAANRHQTTTVQNLIPTHNFSNLIFNCLNTRLLVLNIPSYFMYVCKLPSWTMLWYNILFTKLWLC